MIIQTTQNFVGMMCPFPIAPRNILTLEEILNSGILAKDILTRDEFKQIDLLFCSLTSQRQVMCSTGYSTYSKSSLFDFHQHITIVNTYNYIDETIKWGGSYIEWQDRTHSINSGSILREELPEMIKQVLGISRMMCGAKEDIEVARAIILSHLKI